MNRMFRRDKKQMPGLNTTSTADISFMLLIFFLVTTSLDIDKGISRRLPPISKDNTTEAVAVDKKNLMEIKISANNVVFVNGEVSNLARFDQQILAFIRTIGPQHLITLQMSPDASYAVYFQLQDKLVAAYRTLWNAEAMKRYGKAYAACSASQRDVVRTALPQRIAEEYGEFSKTGGKQP